ncbi:hypothetical protein [Neoaquamicrobium sediminum]|uniref:hypothetical protein n=1 Tax=Neoaquamicrobium sediminum TaxID=1849104 RepID=UPI003BAB1E22
MPKLDFLDFSVKFTGFAKLARANRAGCETRFARVVHDRLIEALERHVRSCRRAVELERLLLTETDAERREALDHELGLCVGDLESGGGGFYPWHLLDAVNGDEDFGGYWHPVAAMHVFSAIPEWMTVGDEHLNGLGVILKQISAETGIKFTTYLCDARIGADGAADLDPDIYEKPIGNRSYW